MWRFIKGVFKSAWTILDFARRALANVLLLVIAGVLIGVFFFDGSAPSVPKRSILVIDLAGEIVEQGNFSGSGALGSVLSGSEPQTRLRDVLEALNIAATDPDVEGVLMRVDDLQAAALLVLGPEHQDDDQRDNEQYNGKYQIHGRHNRKNTPTPIREPF